MSRILIAQLRSDLPVPDFGEALRAHLAAKHNPDARNASLTAWNLLACAVHDLGKHSPAFSDALRRSGKEGAAIPGNAEALPEILFEDSGRPVFRASPLCFSLTHSGSLAAALISDAPCGLDLERERGEVRPALRARCLSGSEAACAPGRFWEFWTRKESLVKLRGGSMPARPAKIDTLDPALRDVCFHTQTVSGKDGESYQLTAALNAGADRPELVYVKL